MKTLFTLMLVGMTITIEFAMAVPAKEERGKVIKVPSFKTVPPKEKESSTFKVVKAYKELTEELTKQLKDESLRLEDKVHVIYMLGELRAADAVPLLIQNIDLDAAPMMKYGAIQWHGRYPAQVALAKIGMPGVTGILNALPGEQDLGKKEVMFKVVYSVLGAETGYTFIDEQLSKKKLSKEKKQTILQEYRKANRLKK